MCSRSKTQRTARRVARATGTSCQIARSAEETQVLKCRWASVGVRLKVIEMQVHRCPAADTAVSVAVGDGLSDVRGTDGHWTVFDLPCGSSRGEQLAVDANLTATTGRPRAEPHVMIPGAINSCFEACFVGGHRWHFIEGLRRRPGYCWCLSHLIDFASLSETASDLVFLGAPPGFRTQNLRIKSLFKALSDRR